MDFFNKDNGTISILNLEDIFEKKLQIIEDALRNAVSSITIGLTGGSTPKIFYQWCAKNKVFSKNQLAKIIWMTSDERYVDLNSDESNFGNADRLMLQPLGVAKSMKCPWDTSVLPKEAANLYNKFFPGENCFDLCFLGMGDDYHTASIFPGSKLLKDQVKQKFTAVEVPSKGWRLTITPFGLMRCNKIIITIVGHNKALPLKQVIEGPKDIEHKPVQLLRDFPEKVIWLMDNTAGQLLDMGRQT